MLNTPSIHVLTTAQGATGAGNVAAVETIAYPLRNAIVAGGGRWVVKGAAVTTLTIILQGRMNATLPWVNVSTIVHGDLNTAPTGGPAAGKTVDLYPEMRTWISVVTSGSTAVVDSWIAG